MHLVLINFDGGVLTFHCVGTIGLAYLADESEYVYIYGLQKYCNNINIIIVYCACMKPACS